MDEILSIRSQINQSIKHIFCCISELTDLPNVLNTTSHTDLDLHSMMNGTLIICSVCLLIISLMYKRMANALIFLVLRVLIN